ncbi:MAG: hypothetical protein KF729_10100 [Sandaracinaceae bacterium]|nr:hypothetical protein [Sandaracinaceae bacterium]
MPYRDPDDALRARAAQLEEALAAALEDNARLRDELTKARAALRVIAHAKKVREALSTAREALERPSEPPRRAERDAG